MSAFHTRWVVGKTIARVEMNPFNAGGQGRGTTAHDPEIFFTDGSSIRFITEETETGEYGTEIVYRKPR